MLPELKAMVKEEWRLHSLLFGNGGFSFFPLLLFILAFIASMLLPIYRMILSGQEMSAILHIAYLFFGLSVGTFGLIGQEALNRRLGDVSLVAYSSRTLPLSERRIFSSFVAKDTLFYTAFLIPPFILAYTTARLLLGFALSNVPLLAATLTLTFLFGLSVSFALTTAYAHFGKWAFVPAAAAAFAYTLHNPSWPSLEGLAAALPPVRLYGGPNMLDFAFSLAFIALLCGVSAHFMKADHRLASKRYRDQFSPLTKRLRLGAYSPFIAKDMLDLNRSEGGLGKIAASYAFPLAAVAVIVGFFAQFLPIGPHHFLLLMGLMAGLVSTSLYSWLAELDFPEAYAFLPLDSAYIIKAKLALYAGVTSVAASAILLSFHAWLAPPVEYFPLSLLLAGSVAAYTTAVTVYLGGLKPNVMLYSGRAFAAYMALIFPPLIVPALAYMTGLPGAAASAAIVLGCAAFMAPAAGMLLTRAYGRWESS
jgi:hypothetical protein